jgi:hypothetical protein
MFEVFASRELKPDLVSRAIMLATKAEFSHVGIIVDGKTLWHATGVGFHSTAVDEFLRDHLFAHRFALKVRSEEYALGWLHGANGKSYAKSQYPGFITSALRSLGDNGERQLICSEAVVLFGKYCCGLDLKSDADFIDPKQAIELMRGVAA